MASCDDDAIEILAKALRLGHGERPGFVVGMETAQGWHVHSDGQACIEHAVPITEGSCFPISSMTKQFTAKVVHTLAGQGRLCVDAPVRRYLPEFPGRYGGTTVRHLLDQRSGIPDPYAWYEDRGGVPYGIRNIEVLGQLDDLGPPLFPAGTTFHYSNANYILLAQLAEAAGGMSLGGLLKELVFSPLGMCDSLLYEARRVIPNRAFGYEADEHGSRSRDIEWLTCGDGGIHSSLNDMRRWLTYVAEHHTELVGRPPQRCDSAVYRNGWFLQSQGSAALMYHYGGDPGFGSYIGWHTGLRRGIVVLANYHDAWKRMHSVMPEVWDRLAHA